MDGILWIIIKLAVFTVSFTVVGLGAIFIALTIWDIVEDSWRWVKFKIKR